MLHELSKIPHPSLQEVAISAEIFCLLYPLRIVMRRIEKQERLLRQSIIKRHVKYHKGRYAHCKCATDPKTLQEQPSQLGQVIASEPEYLFEP